MKKNNIKSGYLILSALLIILGTCFIAFHNSVSILAITVGVILSVYAVVFGAITLANTERGLTFALRIALATVFLVSGISTAVFNNGAASVLVTIFGLLLIVDGSFKLNTAIMLKRYSSYVWWVMLTISCLVIIGGFIITKYPSDTVSETSVYLGIAVLVDALANILSSFMISTYEKEMKAEMLYELKKERDDQSR